MMSQSAKIHPSSNHHKGASGVVLLVISLMQETIATLTSTSAFIDGKNTLFIDFVGNCSTFDKQFSTC